MKKKKKNTLHTTRFTAQLTAQMQHIVRAWHVVLSMFKKIKTQHTIKIWAVANVPITTYARTAPSTAARKSASPNQARKSKQESQLNCRNFDPNSNCVLKHSSFSHMLSMFPKSITRLGFQREISKFSFAKFGQRTAVWSLQVSLQVSLQAAGHRKQQPQVSRQYKDTTTAN